MVLKTVTAVCLAIALFLLPAPLASAATRYASPTGGTTEPCEQGNPCSLEHAITGAKEGDEVIVLGGATPYSVSGSIAAPASLNIHGQAGAAIPEVDYTAKTPGTLLSVGGSTVSRLRLVGTEPEQQLISAGINGVLDGLLLEARASKDTLAVVSGTTLRDSVLSAAASRTEVTGVSSGFALFIAPTSFLRNDTVEVTGSQSTALAANGSCFPAFPPATGCEPILSSSSNFDVSNTILRGGTWDVKTTGSGGFQGNVTLSHTNYRPSTLEAVPGSVTDGGGNQTSVEPSLTSDFHEQAGSTTIDAGVADSHIGAQDPDGNPRTLGAAPDIGAYEFVPPAPPPPPKPTPPPPPAKASVAGATAKGTTVTTTLGCQGLTGQTCQVKIVLTVTEHLLGKRLLSVSARAKKKHQHPHTKRVIVGTLTTTLQAGQVATTSVPLNATGKALLARFRRLPVTVTTSLIDATGKATTIAKSKVTLKAPAKHKRRK